MTHTCRGCGARLTRTFVDLGHTPLANSYLPTAEEAAVAPRFPLHARVCDACWLVQVDEVVPAAEIFSDYSYFSSYSDSWVEHARCFAAWAVGALALDERSLVMEVASNDGYLLRHFRDRGVPVLGVEPAANVAKVAEADGIPTEVAFFGRETAADLVAGGQRADLLVANNVLAHVPDLDDFVGGLALALAPSGILSIEFPHLLRLIEEVQFDTIYHEHFSYFSLLAAERVLRTHGLAVLDVALLPTHGGSLRVLVGHAGRGAATGEGLAAVRARECRAGLHTPVPYEGYADKVAGCRASLRAFFEQARSGGRTVAAYGAAAKGNTLLNTCGITAADIEFVADRNPHKQDLFLPGSAIPVTAPSAIGEARPDDLLILPWNLKDEVMTQLAHVRSWGGRFVTAVPEVRVHQ